jgi:hypothetical protein
MFVDPWIAEYSRIENPALRTRLTAHLSSATRESVEARFVRFQREKEGVTVAPPPEEEVEIFF